MKKHANFRTDSTLGKLPAERQEQIAAFCEAVKDGDRFEATRAHLAEDGIKVSRSAVWSWYQGFALRRDMQEADDLAGFMQEAARAENPQITAEKLDAVGQLIFTKAALARRDQDAYQDIQYLKLAKDTARARAKLENEKLKLAERRVKVMERKLDDLKGILTDGALSPEQREQRMKGVFGLA